MKSKINISYIVSAFALVLLLVACSKDNVRVENNTLDKNLPNVATTIATSYSQFEATLSGSVISDGTSAVTEWGICVGSQPSPVEKVKASGSKDSFSIQVSNLEGGKLYYYRAYAINASGTAYGDEKIFTTEPVIPVVETLSATAENANLLLEGKFVFDGGATLMEKGFCYAQTSDPTVENSTVISLSTTDFTTTIKSLTALTDYYVRAYAINSVGIAYGEVVKVTTGDYPIVDMPLFEDFSGGVVPPYSWDMLDHDGDGKNWYYYSVGGEAPAAGSRSYEDVALTPYNFLITPKVRISGTNPVVRWKTAAHSSSYYEEHYKLVVSEEPITNANCENGSIVKTIFEETLSTDDWAYRQVDLSAYIGKAIFIAWVHYNVSDESRMYISDIQVVNNQPNVIFDETFSRGDVIFPPIGWATIDHDGDSNDWYFYKFKSGTTTATSKSYQGGALLPYNFLITPLVPITGTSPVITWTVEANDEDDFAEHYKVVVSEEPITNANCEDGSKVITIFEETLDTDVKQDKSVDISAYIGKSIYVAWVHYSCTDMSRIYIYDIKIKEQP